MNSLRLLAVGMVVCLLGSSAHGEEKPDLAKMMLGKWEITKADEGTLPLKTIVEFAKDGKITVTMKMDEKEVTMAGKYKIDGQKFTVMFKEGDKEMSHTITVTKITDKEMATKDDEGKVVECKKKS